jgi:hypothetical protein
MRIRQVFAMRRGGQQAATPAVVPVVVVPSSFKFVRTRARARVGTETIFLRSVKVQGQQGLIVYMTMTNVLDAK